MTHIRQVAVAGHFYPEDPESLQRMLDTFFLNANFLHAKPDDPSACPKAIIVPHAGYIFSGALAARAYALLRSYRERIKHIVLLGPAHYKAFYGLALPKADAFDTPLGPVPLNREAMEQLAEQQLAQYINDAHIQEHCLEVQLPFLQRLLSNFTLTPILAGYNPPLQTARALESLWGGEETLIVVSSDLSHYHTYEQAQAIDQQTNEAIMNFKSDFLTPERACGCYPIQGLLKCARQYHLSIELSGLCNSGDTYGDKKRVVGYGAWSLYEN